ncbi:MAG: peptidase inhibitor family I36 protein [Mycobacterium sp.]|nr:peptidase inhibitor family I36 protein [Mycobacterium sp.]
MRRRLVLVAAGAILVGGVLVDANPAQGATCPSGVVCVWRDPNFQGPNYHFVVSDPGFAGQTYAGGVGNLNNSISSMINHSGTTIFFYQLANYSGDWDDSYDPGATVSQVRHDNAYSSLLIPGT